MVVGEWSAECGSVCVLLCCCCCAADGMAECAAAAWLLRCCAAADDADEVRTSLLMRVANGKRLKSDWKSANISLSYLDATSVAKPPPSLKPRMFMSKLS